MGADDEAMARIARARAVRTSAEAAALYRSWATDYDADVFGSADVIGTDRIADLLAAHLPDRAAPIVDLGCGTGAAGARLREHGYTVLDGVDVSPEMLAVAASKKVYRTLVAADLRAGIPVRDGTYAAAVSAGTFRPGHVGVEAVAAIARALRPDAVVAWTIADWAPFAAAVAGWEILHLTTEPFRRGGDAEMTMLVARIASPDATIARPVSAPHRGWQRWHLA